MPTAADIKELYDNCTHVWTTLNGVNGLLFTSNVNGNTLFFPAAGFFYGSVLTYRGSWGYYWSSTYISASNARSLSFANDQVNPQGSDIRRCGVTVRAVLQP